MRVKKVYKLVLMSVMTILLTSGIRAQLVTDGLVAYWPLDQATILGDVVKDMFGKNDGTMKNPKVVKGKVGECIEFDGSAGVEIAGTDALNFNGKTQLTVSAWVNAGSDNPVVGVVAGCCGTIVAQRNANGWALRYDGRNAGAEFELIVCPNWQGDTGFGAPKLKAGEWHYLTGVVDNNRMKLYVDGELVKEQNFNGPITTAGKSAEIGKATDGGFVGKIDEVVIYNKALPADKIKQNMNSLGMLTPVSLKGKMAICWGDIKSRV